MRFLGPITSHISQVLSVVLVAVHPTEQTSEAWRRHLGKCCIDLKWRTAYDAMSPKETKSVLEPSSEGRRNLFVIPSDPTREFVFPILMTWALVIRGRKLGPWLSEGENVCQGAQQESHWSPSFDNCSVILILCHENSMQGKESTTWQMILII